jgi:hypothetical protein
MTPGGEHVHVIRARLDLARIAANTIGARHLTPMPMAEVIDELRNRGLEPEDVDVGWWRGNEATFRSLGDAVLETRPVSGDASTGRGQ